MELVSKRTIVKPILVTGSHRSGSTWAGRIISTAPKVAYIHEPFNVGIKISVNPKRFKTWYKYISDKNSAGYESMIKDIVNFKYPLKNNLKRIGSIRDVAKIARGQGFSILHKIKNDRPLIKDPIALFSSEWLHNKFDMDIVIMIRHPAAFCSSLKIKNWMFNFSNLLNQPLLMRDHLNDFNEEINEFAKNKKDIIEQAILLWNCIHHSINVFRKIHPSWVYIRHEDLSLEPIKLFGQIFERLDLKYTKKTEQSILYSSGDHNPVEQQKGNELKRDSKKNIFNWKKRLNKREISLIRKKTSKISSKFYPEKYWW